MFLSGDLFELSRLGSSLSGDFDFLILMGAKCRISQFDANESRMTYNKFGSRIGSSCYRAAAKLLKKSSNF